MSITQTVKIPASHKLTIDVPSEIPAGATAWVELKVLPFVKNDEKPVSSLKSLAGVETPIADSLLGVAANLGNITLDEIREERLAKYSMHNRIAGNPQSIDQLPIIPNQSIYGFGIHAKIL